MADSVSVLRPRRWSTATILTVLEIILLSLDGCLLVEYWSQPRSAYLIVGLILTAQTAVSIPSAFYWLTLAKNDERREAREKADPADPLARLPPSTLVIPCGRPRCPPRIHSWIEGSRDGSELRVCPGSLP